MNKNFLQALSEHKVVQPTPIEYRVYYDELGNIITASMIQHPDIALPYIVTTSEVYEDFLKYRVNLKTKKLEKVAVNLGLSVNLKKSDHGYPVVKNHAGLLLESDETYSDIEYYDTTN